jgi:hypothetical protein
VAADEVLHAELLDDRRNPGCLAGC